MVWNVGLSCFHHSQVPGIELQAATIRLTATKIEGNVVVNQLGPAIEIPASQMTVQK